MWPDTCQSDRHWPPACTPRAERGEQTAPKSRAQLPARSGQEWWVPLLAKPRGGHPPPTLEAGPGNLYPSLVRTVLQV